MANNFEDSTPDALSDVRRDSERLAQRVTTPWWYHVALAAITMALVGAIAAPFTLTSILIAGAVIALAALGVLYRRVSGLDIPMPAGPRSTRMFRLVMVLLVVTMGAALVIYIAEWSRWWVLIPVVAVGIGVWLLGVAYDRALRDDLTEDAQR